MQKNFFLKFGRHKLNKKDNQIVELGLSLLKKTKDGVHGVDHVKALWKSYLDFKKANPNKMYLDDRVMAQAIVFHDIWKAQADRSKYFFKVILEEYFEGSWSADIYREHALMLKIDKKVIEKVVYAIKKHSTGNLLPRSTNEAKLLFDLDELEFFKFRRFKKGFENFKFGVDRQVAAAKSYFRMRSKKGFYFDWSHEKFEKRKNKFLNGLNKLKKEIAL